jgi:hypothetical protein
MQEGMLQMLVPARKPREAAEADDEPDGTEGTNS